MGTNHLTTTKRSVSSKDNSILTTKPANKKIKSRLVRVTLEEINAIRPSVYKYLLP
jgi:hypothetical protein